MLYHTGMNNQLLLLEASVSADWKTQQLHFLLHQRHIIFSTAELAHTNEHKTRVVDKDKEITVCTKKHKHVNMWMTLKYFKLISMTDK